MPHQEPKETEGIWVLRNGMAHRASPRPKRIQHREDVDYNNPYRYKIERVWWDGKIVFASDCPFDPEKGTMYIRETIRILDALDLTKEQRDQVYYKNLERITGKRFVK